MKYIFTFIAFFLCFTYVCQAQITSYKVEKPAVQPRVAVPYDSTENITRDNLISLIGQQIQILPQKRSGNLGLETGPTFYSARPTQGYSSNNSLVIKPDTRFTSYKSKFGAFDNEVFDIVGCDSIKHEYSDSKTFYLKVKNTKYPSPIYLELGMSHDIYTGGVLQKRSELYAPPSKFIIIGYFNKLKKSMVGRKFVNKYTDNYSFFNPGNIVYRLSDGSPLNEIPKNNVWTIADVSFVETDNYAGLSYILTSDAIKDVFCRASVSDFTPYEEYVAQQQAIKDWEKSIIKKYGSVNGKLIIDGRVKVGFTKQMCEDAWGKPDHINTTTGRYGVTEQWVYGSRSYLYFKNGKLTSIQN